MPIVTNIYDCQATPNHPHAMHMFVTRWLTPQHPQQPARQRQASTRVVWAGVLLAEQVVVLVLRQQQPAFAHATQLRHHAVHKAHLRAARARLLSLARSLFGNAR